jgi:redox-sensitive bicupin YhaK (pirin superfamily)
LEATLVPGTRDLGDGFKVRRALPSAKRRMIGPFVFLDEMGPTRFAPGTGLDVRPHPHIGLATVTYLFDGEILHRDSLGVAQPIRPGDVNWMIAGRGIVHSERTPQALRSEGSSAWGLQSYPSTDLPRSDGDGQQIRIIAGQMFGVRSPVETLSEMFYADATLEANTQLPIAPEHEERGAYIVEGSLSVDGQSFERGRLLVFRPGTQVLLSALQ